MTKRLIKLAVVLFAASACAPEAGLRGEGLGSVPADAGVPDEGSLCATTWTQPLRITSGSKDTIGSVDVREDVGALVFALSTSSDAWTIGDVYVGIGPFGSLSWHTANTQPWITGWQRLVEVRVPLSSARGVCGGQVKIVVQARVMSSSGGVHLASAEGSHDMAPWGWYDMRDICCDGDVDGDGDGYSSDCDDSDPSVHPGAEEACNGVDDDCDGEVDGAAAWTWCQDPSREPPNTIEGCVAGECEIITCDIGFGTCDGSGDNGCETDVRTSSEHCGACGNACDFACADRSCVLAMRTSSGDGFSCAASDTEGAWCWGRNDDGQLGDGTTNGSLVPVRVAGLDGFVTRIDSGRDHTCAIVAGELWCWGRNDRGQLGDGTTIDRSAPVQVLGLGPVTAFAAGGSTTCAIHFDPTSSMREVACFGAGDEGQLGGTTDSATPVAVSLGAIEPDLIDVGAAHVCASSFRGTLQCWGRNTSGQLGDGTTTSRATPGPVTITDFEAAVLVLGGDHTCLFADFMQTDPDPERWVCWGDNAYGQLMDGTTTDAVTAPVEHVGIAIMAAGPAATCSVDSAFSTDRTCWGAGYGVTGTVISGTASAFEMSLGPAHGCGVDAGVAVCWGDNAHGQLGDGTTTPSPAVAQPVSPAAG